MSDTAHVLTTDARGFLHATTVSIAGQGVMLIGPSGSGKSSLALELIGLGAKLVADDLTRVASGAETPTAYAPDKMAGLIEARGLGLIHVPHVLSAPVKLVVDLSQVEQERLPPSRPVTFVTNQPVRTVWRVDDTAFPSAIFHMVKFGGHEYGR
ncbi:HPr kinase/phosphatase C-terminal domain-containing protein [Aliiroseovarius sp. KMU-50]|uniref:HPr kinase/phosphatase C-terminal domain-containing protein n=1 Tax=Aliiroseovarius salicola TaxID=3009082 RepID=A0ABT4VY78_9RHOB|nr:HPr kinase/phosphatase C-terminal domain-containing protein [Aliiroseovarius sp. KMU-50]MDA5093208.1 HPr kinase/phosphatase C-terminal domain-containing protein [Aliiroseovarius sp. KMU-50]